MHEKKKRKANMKVRDCMNYINTDILRVGTAAALADKGVSWSTARAWLHRLGFMVLSHSKGTCRQFYMTDCKHLRL